MIEHQLIVIPAYNEERRIEVVVTQFGEHFGKRATILVVMNGCRDQTGEIVRRLARQQSNIRYLDFSDAIGKGRAVQEGIRYFLAEVSGYKFQDTSLIGFVDADGATDAKEYDRLSGQLGDADGVVGSRFLPGAEVSGRSFLRGLIGRAFHLIVWVLFRLPFSDTQCGVKIFRADAIRKMLPELTVRNMAFDVEMLLAARKHGFIVREIATRWNGKADSGSLGSLTQIVKTGWNMFWTILSLKRRF